MQSLKWLESNFQLFSVTWLYVMLCIWINIFLHFCLYYSFVLLFRMKAARRTYWLKLSVKCKAYTCRPSYKCKINDALSQCLKLLVECSIDVYSLHFSRGKHLEQLMTCIFAFFLPYWGKTCHLRALIYLYFGNPTLWYQSILHSGCVYVNWTAVHSMHEIASWFS